MWPQNPTVCTWAGLVKEAQARPWAGLQLSTTAGLYLEGECTVRLFNTRFFRHTLDITGVKGHSPSLRNGRQLTLHPSVRDLETRFQSPQRLRLS